MSFQKFLLIFVTDVLPALTTFLLCGAQAAEPTFDPFASGSFYTDATPAPVATLVPLVYVTETAVPAAEEPVHGETGIPTHDPFSTGSFYDQNDTVLTAAPEWPAARDNAEMVYVKEGPFLMGSDADTAFLNAKPAHQVLLKGFWIDKYEITNAQYKVCVELGYCTVPRDLSSATRSDYYNNEDYADYPVIHVDWNQAAAYCSWAGKRLPTEAEWEKAARGPEGALYPWGSTLSQPIPMAVNSFPDGDTFPVDAFPEGVSPYGAFNMAGNVWEWTADQYDAYYYSKSPLENPKSVTGGNDYVIRGFSWAYPFNIFDITVRNSAYILNHTYDLGFRCAAGD